MRGRGPKIKDPIYWHAPNPLLKVKLDTGARAPQRMTDGSVGYDVQALCDTDIEPGETVRVHTGVHVEPPYGFRVSLHARSSLCIKHHCILANSVGIVDMDYRGEVQVPLYNYGAEPVHIQAHERIAQLVVEPVYTPTLAIVDELSNTERGQGGFGSTDEQPA